MARLSLKVQPCTINALTCVCIDSVGVAINERDVVNGHVRVGDAGQDGATRQGFKLDLASHNKPELHIYHINLIHHPASRYRFIVMFTLLYTSSPVFNLHCKESYVNLY